MPDSIKEEQGCGSERRHLGFIPTDRERIARDMRFTPMQYKAEQEIESGCCEESMI